MARKSLNVCAGMLLLALCYHFDASSAVGQGANTLLAMTDYPRQQYSAVALDRAGGIYFGHLQQWTRVGTTPGEPAAIWSRPDGGVLIALTNGDVYQLGSPALPVGDWTLAYDSNVFGFGGPTPTQRESWGQVKSRYAPNRGTAHPGGSGR